jgi:hypothetical protein
MSFGATAPPPMIVPPAPTPPPALTPATQKPGKKPSQPSMVSASLAPPVTGAAAAGGKSLLGT